MAKALKECFWLFATLKSSAFYIHRKSFWLVHQFEKSSWIYETRIKSLISLSSCSTHVVNR